MSKHLWLSRAFRARLKTNATTACRSGISRGQRTFALLELGAAGEWGLNAGGSGSGPTAAIEFTAISNWRAIEPSVTTLFGQETKWDTGFVFRKPFDLSPTVESSGVSIRTVGHGRTTDSIGVEAAAHFEIWPTPERQYGWFLEPSYTRSFGSSHERFFGVGTGLLISIQ